ncbi:MAG: TetR/AcrR family transcriptional regulator [Phycisphaerales bacterium]|nr:TetR/AcrR family transcriptional regulator [Phycisphaerales bacterium]
MAQRPDEAKRQEILAVAAKLFARRPFHEVKLDEVASEAGVGKGTVYCYFPSKEDLHFSIVESGFRSLVDQIGEALEESHDSAWEQLRVSSASLSPSAARIRTLRRSCGRPANRSSPASGRSAPSSPR